MISYSNLALSKTEEYRNNTIRLNFYFENRSKNFDLLTIVIDFKEVEGVKISILFTFFFLSIFIKLLVFFYRWKYEEVYSI